MGGEAGEVLAAGRSGVVRTGSVCADVDESVDSIGVDISSFLATVSTSESGICGVTEPSPPLRPSTL